MRLRKMKLNRDILWLIWILDSGTRKPTEPEWLFQKYLKTIQKPNHKNTVSMNILTVENIKLENQKIEVKLAKETSDQNFLIKRW